MRVREFPTQDWGFRPWKRASKARRLRQRYIDETNAVEPLPPIPPRPPRREKRRPGKPR